VAVYDYEASNKEKKQLKADVKEERKQADALVSECESIRESCMSTCTEEPDTVCKSQCSAEFVQCAGDILFEGQTSS